MRTSLRTEHCLPYLLALVAGAAWWYWGLSLPKSDSILNASLNLGAILTGFLGTTKAILMSLHGNIIDRLRSTGYINDLASYLSRAILSSLMFSLTALLGFFIDHQNGIFGLTWISVATFMVATFILVTRIMLKILRNSQG